jgi:hypothetical protein
MHRISIDEPSENRNPAADMRHGDDVYGPWLRESDDDSLAPDSGDVGEWLDWLHERLALEAQR